MLHFVLFFSVQQVFYLFCFLIVWFFVVVFCITDYRFFFVFCEPYLLNLNNIIYINIIWHGILFQFNNISVPGQNVSTTPIQASV